MDTVQDFADLLECLERHHVRYLIVGGLAFIYHAKPRFTKDMDIWVEPTEENLRHANRALVDFGSPYLLDTQRHDSILQIGLPPNRIDILQTIEGVEFEDAWPKREVAPYGPAQANWIDLDSLIAIKERIDDPRHRADARDLRRVREMRRSSAGRRARRGDPRRACTLDVRDGQRRTRTSASRTSPRTRAQ